MVRDGSVDGCDFVGALDRVRGAARREAEDADLPCCAVDVEEFEIWEGKWVRNGRIITLGNSCCLARLWVARSGVRTRC